ncbi:hypothetical protein F1880_001594 [Penicillium rolfsii]|nr:hypothetical protein F1880_001594 [Penicillium rolfsii]
MNVSGIGPITGDSIRTIPCQLCDKKFVTQRDADQHMLALNHYRNRCDLCQQRFPSMMALLNHAMSYWHCIHNIFCPFCGSRFEKASILMGHLEEAQCENAPGLDHHNILWLVRNCDPSGVIIDTTFRWLRNKWIPTPPLGVANPHMCFTCHLIFDTKEALEVHLQFPTKQADSHRPRVYRCPNRTGGCHKRYFVSLTAVLKHMESGSCSTTDFYAVQRMQIQLMQTFWGCGSGEPKRRDAAGNPIPNTMHPDIKK